MAGFASPNRYFEITPPVFGNPLIFFLLLKKYWIRVQKIRTKVRIFCVHLFCQRILVGLTRLDSNKYKALINRRRQFVPSSSIVPEVEISDNRAIDEFGEMVVKRLEQLYRKDFSEDDIELVISNYQSGSTTIDLAKQFGCSKGTINKLLRKCGVNVTKAKAQAKLDDGVVVAMYEEERHTIEEIARHFGVSSYTVNRCLHSNGVKIRNRWDYATK